MRFGHLGRVVHGLGAVGGGLHGLKDGLLVEHGLVGRVDVDVAPVGC